MLIGQREPIPQEGISTYEQYVALSKKLNRGVMHQLAFYTGKWVLMLQEQAKRNVAG